jgi:hypothetical protein
MGCASRFAWQRVKHGARARQHFPIITGINWFISALLPEVRLSQYSTIQKSLLVNPKHQRYIDQFKPIFLSQKTINPFIPFIENLESFFFIE